MAETTKIEWADATFNPWVGCTKVSPACDHCYAESWAKRTGAPELWAGERRRTSEANWRQPLLGPVDLDRWWRNAVPGGKHMHGNGIDWVIAGGESGPRARPSHPDWFRSLRDQCAAAGVPFHFKQWGEWAPTFEPNGTAHMLRAGKARAGRLLDGREHNEVPE